jgi:hypothetical protein
MKIIDLKVSQTLEGTWVARYYTVYKRRGRHIFYSFSKKLPPLVCTTSSCPAPDSFRVSELDLNGNEITNRRRQSGTRVARCYVFKSKIQIWVTFGVPQNEKSWFYGPLEYITAIWYLLWP